jgi:hypothetical protein
MRGRQAGSVTANLAFMTSARVRSIALLATVSVVVAIGGVAPASAASSSATSVSATTYTNCTALNKKYKHGVGKSGARDKVSGSSKPVTNFYVNTALYNANKKSDRDKDGVACEKR